MPHSAHCGSPAPIHTCTHTHLLFSVPTPQLVDLREDRARLRDELDAAAADLAAARTDLATATADLESRDLLLQQLQRQLSEARAAQEHAAAAAEAARDGAARRQAELTEQLAATRRTTEDLEAEAVVAVRRLAAAERRAEELDARARDAEERVGELTERVGAAEGELLRLRAEQAVAEAEAAGRRASESGDGSPEAVSPVKADAASSPFAPPGEPCRPRLGVYAQFPLHLFVLPLPHSTRRCSTSSLSVSAVHEPPSY